MGHREVRPVAIGWEHPRDPGTYSDGSPRYRPLFSRADLLNHERDRGEDPDYEIDPANYMPPIPEGTSFGYALYETTTEGTPVSPVCETLEELATWCADNATVFASLKWSREEWLASFRAGTTDVDSIPVFGKR